jgi:putative PEP-CTERM system response regulator
LTEQNRKLLIVEDDPGLLSQLKWCFEGYDVVTAVDRNGAITELRRHDPMVVLQDLGLPPNPEGVDEGLATLQELLNLSPHTKVIVVTGHGDQENALRSVALGAYDFYQKPVDTDTLQLLVERAFNMSELEGENRRLQNVASESPLDGIIAASEGMLSVCRMIEKIAPTNVTTLLLGESGTGKELLARAIHRASPRRDKAFVAINCSAMAENLLESELFGHMKGAFTGAIRSHEGLFQAADGGTLLLDEIGDMPMRLQVKLLRVLQENQVRPVGSTEAVDVDVRVLSATHRNLQQMLQDGQFREDLFYRLNVVQISLPVLNDRREDIPLLVSHFLQQISAEAEQERKVYAPEAVELLVTAEWPGNVRQLHNIVRQNVALSRSPVISGELVQTSLGDHGAKLASFSEARDEFTRNYLSQILQITMGNVSQAARLAKRNRTDFYKLLARHGLNPDAFKTR